jgi:hypothetical protein
MDLERRPKLVLDARPGGGRGRGRPRLEWEEYVEGLARKRGRNLPEVRRLTQNRREYRKWLLLESDAYQQKGMMTKKKKVLYFQFPIDLHVTYSCNFTSLYLFC